MDRSQLKIESRVVIEKCWVARGYFDRLRGLMGKRGIAGDEAVLFPRCNSIHTFFMRFPIDVVFVNERGVVTEVLDALAPWRMLLPRSKGRHVIEMRARLAGELGITVGRQLYCEGVWS